MKYTSASAFRTALEKRLLTTSQQTGTSLMRLRKLVVFDRLLARFLVVAPDRWILKGALALDYRLNDMARTTKDLDLSRQDGEEAATEDFVAVQELDLGDYFSFEIVKTSRLDVALEGAAVRYRAMADLAGRRFEDVIIDVGFGDPVILSPEVLQGPDLLSFANIDPVMVPTLPLAQHIAEKVHAYTRTYGSQRSSTRVKDLVDLVLIQAHSDFQASTLRAALNETFNVRGSHPLPDRLPPPPPFWTTAYRNLAVDVGIPRDIAEGFGLVARFLDPVLDGTIPEDGCWDTKLGSWEV